MIELRWATSHYTEPPVLQWRCLRPDGASWLWSEWELVPTIVFAPQPAPQPRRNDMTPLQELELDIPIGDSWEITKAAMPTPPLALLWLTHTDGPLSLVRFDVQKAMFVDPSPVINPDCDFIARSLIAAWNHTKE